MPDSLRWTLTTAAAECGVSTSTIKRRLAAGDLPGATKNARGAWSIPVTDLIAAGLRPGRPRPPDHLTQVTDLGHGSFDPGHDLGHEGSNPSSQRISELERDLAQERERTRSLTQANADLRTHVDDMRTALRMLEPAESDRLKPAPSTATAKPRSFLDRFRRHTP